MSSITTQNHTNTLWQDKYTEILRPLRNFKSSLLSMGSYTQINLDSLRNRSIRRLLTNFSWLNAHSSYEKCRLTAIKILSVGKNTLYSYEECLPSLPIPPLDQTLDHYLESVKPLVSTEQFAKTEKAVESFRHGEGRILQENFSRHVQGQRNWLAPLWEELAYLRQRGSLLTTSNWYGVGPQTDYRLDDPKRQIHRASEMITSALSYRESVKNGTLPPLVQGGVIPFCMDQYRRLFATTRVPGEEVDELKTFEDSEHLVVFVQGASYALKVYDEKHQALSFDAIYQALEDILEDANKTPGQDLGFVTAQNRTDWAKLRQNLQKDELNKNTLKIIEESLFTISLEETSPSTIEEEAKMNLLNTKNRWFDKGMHMIFYANAKVGANVEHTWGDATIGAAFMEYLVKKTCEKSGKIQNKAQVERLEWNISQNIQLELDQTQKIVAKEAATVDLNVLEFKNFGKDLFKNAGLSPDSAIQMAMQLAYYQTFSTNTLTYESASTRAYYKGRTETVRSASVESKEFVETMLNSELDKNKKYEALLKAIHVHDRRKKDAMMGNGIDRILIALRVFSMKLGMQTSMFTDEAWQMPYDFTTSQTPCSGLTGGGFPPPNNKSGKELGVSYAVFPKKLFFHCTSPVPEKTKEFVKNLEASLHQIQNLLK
jgi:hypothetical protein